MENNNLVKEIYQIRLFHLYFKIDLVNSKLLSQTRFKNKFQLKYEFWVRRSEKLFYHGQWWAGICQRVGRWGDNRAGDQNSSLSYFATPFLQPTERNALPMVRTIASHRWMFGQNHEIQVKHNFLCNLYWDFQLNRIKLESFKSPLDFFEQFMIKGVQNMSNIAMIPFYPSHLLNGIRIVNFFFDVDAFNISTFIHFQPPNAVLAATKKGKFISYLNWMKWLYHLLNVTRTKFSIKTIWSLWCGDILLYYGFTRIHIICLKSV